MSPDPKVQAVTATGRRQRIRPYSLGFGRRRSKSRRPLNEPIPRVKDSLRETQKGLSTFAKGLTSAAIGLALATPVIIRAYVAMRKTKKRVKRTRQGARRPGRGVKGVRQRVARKIRSKPK